MSTKQTADLNSILENFSKDIVFNLTDSILKQVKDCRFVSHTHSNQRYVPDDVVEQVWKNVNWESVIKEVTSQVQDRIAATLVQSMLTEVKTDVKSVLSIQGVRQKLRAEAYPIIMKILDDN